MWGITTVVGAFMLALVAMSFAFMGGAVVIAVPLAIVVIAITGFLDLRRRSAQAWALQDHRRQADEDGMRFTARDRETLVSE
ncbi:MAG TPA: hypothetical protein VFQ12_09005 [Thermoleophilaceae bacterium]|nr:hypothetical protein [Thermoleophilaceae bacterium]